MNTWIKKNFNTLLIIFILLQPILDLITGFAIHVWHINVTLGIIVRMLFLIIILSQTEDPQAVFLFHLYQK